MSFTNRPMSIPRYRHGSRVPGWDDAVDLTKPPATVPDPATTEVPAELRGAVEAAMSARGARLADIDHFDGKSPGLQHVISIRLLS